MCCVNPRARVSNRPFGVKNPYQLPIPGVRSISNRPSRSDALAAAFDRIFVSGSSVSLFRPRSRPHRHRKPKMPTLRCVSPPRRRARGPLRSTDRRASPSRRSQLFPPQEFGPIPEIPSTRAADDPFTSRRDRSALKSRAATSRSLTPNSTTSRSPAAGSPSSSASRPTPPRLASASTPRGRRKSSSR